MSEIIPPVNMLDEELSSAVESNPTDIRLAAMNLLARREHTVRELRNKLQRRFPDDQKLNEQLSRLTEERLQSDMRFAESYARQRITRGYGPLRLREELRERGVSDDDVMAAMAELEIDWSVLATEVVHKKFGTLDAIDLKEKARRARFMQYRGFCSDHYQHLL